MMGWVDVKYHFMGCDLFCSDERLERFGNVRGSDIRRGHFEGPQDVFNGDRLAVVPAGIFPQFEGDPVSLSAYRDTLGNESVVTCRSSSAGRNRASHRYRQLLTQ